MASEAKKEQTKKARKWISQEKREVIFLFLFPRGSFFLFLFWACFAWSGREWALHVFSVIKSVVKCFS